MEVRFQQGKPSKLWRVDIKDKHNEIESIDLVIDGAYNKNYSVEHHGKVAFLRFKDKVTGKATITLKEGRSLYASMFGVTNAS